MKNWLEGMKGAKAKKPIPVLSFPCVSLLGVTVRELISDSEFQAKGMLEVSIDGKVIDEIYLSDDPADSRGALSHHYQPVDDLLEEAGTYGTLCDVTVPSALLLKLKEKENFKLTLTMKDDKGLSIFSRTSGRYGLGIVFKLA